MDQLILIASVFGPYQFIIGLWMLLHKKNCEKICDSVRKSPAAIYLMGWSSLLLGLFIIYGYNFWVMNISIFVTLLGWAYFIRAIIILFVPQVYLKTETKEKAWITSGAVLRIIWGVALIWIAVQ